MGNITRFAGFVSVCPKRFFVVVALSSASARQIAAEGKKKQRQGLSFRVHIISFAHLNRRTQDFAKFRLDSLFGDFVVCK